MEFRSGIAVVLPTYKRSKDLKEALESVLRQTTLPEEVIIVDNSPACDTETVALCSMFRPRFSLAGVELKYIRSPENSLTVARNLGVRHASGDIIFFLEDDATLDERCLEEICKVYEVHPEALGVQGKIVGPFKTEKQFYNLVCKIFFLAHVETNTWRVLPSGEDVFPNPITKTIRCMRLCGISSYRRSVFKEIMFDEKLKTWAFLEDTDFSYRVYKKYPSSLYLTPAALIYHKSSNRSRLQRKVSTYMMTAYRLYFYFKNVEQTLQSVTVLLWSMFGRLVCATAGLILRKKPRRQWWGLIYLIGSYIFTFKHSSLIKKGNLEFFNKLISGKSYDYGPRARIR